MAIKDCEQCGSPFVPTGPARYCGDDCRTEVQAVQLTASMYALTVEQTRAVRAVQACMICDSTVSGFESGIFAVDHCHDTGVVRGAFSELPGRPVIRRRDDQSREEGPENGCERRGC